MDCRYDSYCGLYCGACDVLSANEHGQVWKLARDWNRSVDELKCHGCKSDAQGIFCSNCSIRRCALSKSVEFCDECKEYPCATITAFRDDEQPHHSVAVANLEVIGRDGVDAWLAAQQKRWKCPSCGTRFTWYDRACKHCGAELYTCEAEEKDLLAPK